jgi:predicted phage tail protein
VSAVADDGQATVSWTAPSKDGRSAMVSSTVTASTGQFVTVAATERSAVVTGLSSGSAVTFTVHATNAVGDSPESEPSAAVTPAGVPGQPTNLVATAGPQSAHLTWTAPVSNGGSAITGYTVQQSTNGVDYVPGIATVSGASADVTGLPGGTTYTFQVFANNAAGSGQPSAPSNAITPPRRAGHGGLGDPRSSSRTTLSEP